LHPDVAGKFANVRIKGRVVNVKSTPTSSSSPAESSRIKMKQISLEVSLQRGKFASTNHRRGVSTGLGLNHRSM
jgi:hypothetical protein